MSGSLYRALGFFVWKTVKFYLGQKSPGRAKLVLGAAVVVAAVLAAGIGAKRQVDSDPSTS